MFIKTRPFVVPVLASLILGSLIGNYFYTFSGFVAYSETERRGCDLLEIVYKETNTETRAARARKFNDENEKILFKHVDQYKSKNYRCKSIQQFYLEEAFLIFAAGALYFVHRNTHPKIFKHS